MVSKVSKVSKDPKDPIQYNAEKAASSKKNC